MGRWLAGCLALAVMTGARGETLRAVPFTSVRLTDTFWAPRIKLNRETVLPHNFRYCEETGRIRNFDRAAGKLGGSFEGTFFDDSDVYKVIEGAAYSLHQTRDPELEALTDSVIARIAAAQQPDGYLYCYYTVRRELDKRFTDEPQMHETYCAGHLFEAAVAYYRATGKRSLLDVAIKLADHLCTRFGPGKNTSVPGHQECELALVKLYEVTGTQRYLDLARFWVDERGVGTGRKLTGEYDQDHKPLRQQSEICGHAVRGMYNWAGVADVAARIGDKDLMAASARVWDDVVGRKMYITGGIGPSAHNEGFTVAYDLPNDSAYAETCASIGMALWNHRLNLLHGDAKFADVLERVMYNGLISGVSLGGDRFFYVNPLGGRGRHHRQAWFGCACCPTNVTRWLPSVGGYQYAQTDDSVYINLYAAGTAAIALRAGEMKLEQATDYPWDGRVKLTVSATAAAETTLALRLPGWARHEAVPSDLYRFAEGPSGPITLTVNGRPLEVDPTQGYAKVKRVWKAGDTLELNLPMHVQRVIAHPEVKANEARVALQRGPIVYCVEGADVPEARHLILAPGAELKAEHQPALLGGVTVIRGRMPVAVRDDAPREVAVTAVPYYAWDNRAAGPMVVWMPADAAHADPLPKPTAAGLAKVSASHCWHLDSLDALNDQAEPAKSGDHGVPRLTWWDHRGTTEWAQYEWAEPRRVAKVSVYWFDDSGTGACRVPASWTLSYRDGDQWKPVVAKGPFGTALDGYNQVEFEPVSTTALRLEAKLKPDVSGGILEWKVD